MVAASDRLQFRCVPPQHRFPLACPAWRRILCASPQCAAKAGFRRRSRGVARQRACSNALRASLPGRLSSVRRDLVFSRHSACHSGGHDCRAQVFALVTRIKGKAEMRGISRELGPLWVFLTGTPLIVPALSGHDPFFPAVHGLCARRALPRVFFVWP